MWYISKVSQVTPWGRFWKLPLLKGKFVDCTIHLDKVWSLFYWLLNKTLNIVVFVSKTLKSTPPPKKKMHSTMQCTLQFLDPLLKIHSLFPSVSCFGYLIIFYLILFCFILLYFSQKNWTQHVCWKPFDNSANTTTHKGPKQKMEGSLTMVKGNIKPLDPGQLSYEKKKKALSRTKRKTKNTVFVLERI